MSADQRRGPYITILTTTLLALSVFAAAAQATFYGPGGNYQGQANWRRNTGTFYDAKGNFIGNSVTVGRSTSFFGRDGAYEGTLGRLGNTTTFYDRAGRYQGYATTIRPPASLRRFNFKRR
jgi:hypothetical protein